MVPTRRQTLAGAATLLAALAGCSAGDRSTDPPPADDDEDRFARPEHVATDPPTVTLRRSGGREPIVTVADATATVTDREAELTARARRRAVEQGFVTDADAASLLGFADVDGADAARRFVAETDFEESFLFVDRASVPQCYERVLCFVTWSADELRRTYAEVYRDYDVACDAGERDGVVRLVRLPGTVDPDRIESGGTHTRRGGCPVPRWERRRPDGQGGTATENGTAADDRTTRGDGSAPEGTPARRRHSPAGRDARDAATDSRNRRWRR